MSVQVEISEANFDFPSILKKFDQQETLQTGSIVIHRGKVKMPGKKVADLSHVVLEKKNQGDLAHELRAIGEQAHQSFHLLQVYIHHRLGQAYPGDDILLVMVSAPDRLKAFTAAHWIVDEIKKETLITLSEVLN